MSEKYPNPNYPLFYDKISNIFSDYKISKRIIEKEVVPDFCVRMGSKKEDKGYQKFVAGYLSENTPYRGLLVYHGLGSGKTRTGLRTMNKNPNMSVVIISPASLRNMWKLNVKWRYKGRSKVYYVAYNASNFVKQMNDVPSVNNKLIIIDESHTYFQNVISGKAKQALEVYNMLFHSKGSKFLFLTGTPISGDPFELVPCFNLLKGKLYLEPHERKRKKNKYLTLFPIHRQKFWEVFASDEFNSIKNSEIFKERITGLVSYFRELKDEYRYVIPENLGIKVIYTPMQDIQWITFLKIRAEEAKIERIYKYKTTAFKEAAYKRAERASTGTYKVNSRMASNFSVGQKAEEIYSSIPKLKRRDIIDWSFILQKFPLLKKANLPERKTEVAEIKWSIYVGLIDRKVNNIKELSRYSNKLGTVLKMVTDKSRLKMKKFIFSEYKVFGTRLIAYFLTKLFGFIEVRNESNITKGKDYKRFCIIDGDTKNKEIIKKLYNDKENLYGKQISIILGTKVISVGYTFKEVREIYIFEPQWRDIMIEQIMGRPIRLCSHQNLPIEERTVQTYIFLSIPKSEMRSLLPRADNGLSTDEILYELANSKSEFISTYLHALKEGAIDCKLNIYVNQKSGKEKIVCEVCAHDNPEAIIIPKDYKDHLVSGQRCVLEEVKKRLFPIDKKDGYIPKIHKDMKRDPEGSVYKKDENTDIWEEIGYIRESQIFLYN